MPDIPLRRLSYVSRAAATLDARSVDDIVVEARRRNGSDGLTGALGYTGDLFVQVLEGPAPAVEAVLARITADPRHHDLKVVGRVEAPRRAFGDWSMASLDLTEFADELRALHALGKLNDGWLLLRLKEEMHAPR
jgi:hypothetical protein